MDVSDDEAARAARAIRYLRVSVEVAEAATAALEQHPGDRRAWDRAKAAFYRMTEAFYDLGTGHGYSFALRSRLASIAEVFCERKSAVFDRLVDVERRFGHTAKAEPEVNVPAGPEDAKAAPVEEAASGKPEPCVPDN